MKRKILIVDDNIHMVEIVRFKLLEQGFEVITAHNGQEGLEKVKTHQPDLIILDVLMPRLTGLEMKEKLKEGDLTKDIPIIFITSSLENDNEKRIDLMSEGYVVLDKIVELEDLFSSIKKLFNY